MIPYWNTLPVKLQQAIVKADAKNTLCPPRHLIFKAFHSVPDYDVKVVILGQDPYFVPGKASGLAFGYHPSYRGNIDSSLRNILREVKEDTGRPSNADVTLQQWANQGVLLLNTRLTTVAGKALAHANLGWEELIREYLISLDNTVRNKVYFLWGRQAQEVAAGVVDAESNLVLTAAHPSGLSAHRGFFGCGHFSEANDYLEKRGRGGIEW